MEAEDIVIENSVFNQVVMDALSEQHFCSLRDFSFDFSVDLKTRRSSKAKELCFLEMPHNIFVHIAELTSMAFVDDENDFFIFICIHDFSILRTLDCICHLLHGGNNELPVLILHLFNENIGAVGCIHRSVFKLVEFFRSLRVQVFAVNKEDDFLDIWIGCLNLSRLKRGQSLTGAGCMPDVSIAVCQRCLPNKRFNSINLIRTHNHQQLVRIIQNHIPCQHFDDMVTGKESYRKILQIRKTNIIKVRPKECEAM